MSELGPLSPRFRVKKIEAAQPGPWDGEWYYHFREGGYGSMEWVELQLKDESQRDDVSSVLASINLPGAHTTGGFIVYGHVMPGTFVEYIRSSSNKSLERTREG
jgi:hypothetical protein